MTLTAIRAALPRRCPHLRLQAPRRAFSLTSRSLCPNHAAQSISHESPTATSSQDKSSRPGGLSALLKRDRSRAKGEGHSPGKPSQDKVRRIFGQPSDKPIRARFAPSPTGHLHLGSLRTALFNNLASEASKEGSFVLRIEDTDQNRLVEGATESIIKDLKWLGLEWQEGPDCGGPYGPYRQSERLDIYKDHVNKLIHSGHAYRCFCDPKHLEAERLRQHEAGEPTVYPKTCRSIDAAESERRAEAGEGHVVRFKGDAFGVLNVRDAVYGPFQKKEAEEDFIILKTDGFPTYHLANVVDDHLMKITHVIRGEEWLISTPKHIALYKAFEWQPPTFAHLGLLVNDDSSKLSKRQSSANLSTYKERGISPLPLQVWLARLGSSFTDNTNNPVNMPRSLKEVSEKLSFKFTRGSIKLNLTQLDNIESTYRRAIMTTSASNAEDDLIKSTILVPTLAKLRYLTSSESLETPFVDQAWLQSSKDPVLALSNSTADAESALAKLKDIYWWLVSASSATSLQAMEDLLLRHPYLFWRVPEDLYRRSLALAEPHVLHDEFAILSTFERLCEEPAHWSTTVSDLSNVGQPLIDAVAPKTAEEKQAIYATHRLITTGRMDLPSPSVNFLANLLGREESLHRVRTVRALAAQLREGGDAVRQQWLEEAWTKYPAFMSSTFPGDEPRTLPSADGVAELRDGAR